MPNRSQKKHKKLTFKYLTPIFILITCQCGCINNVSYRLSQGEIFHTDYHIKYEYNESLADEIFSTLNDFNSSLNPFDSTSIISMVNQNKDVSIDSFFSHVFNKAKDVSIETNGAFDITCAPLVNFWGFGFRKPDSIHTELIDSLKEFVGYNKIHLKNGKVKKDDPRVQLNCSAIAKGYACDVIAELLDSYKIKNYMIEIGGEIRAKGKNPNGDCWKIEISQPIDDKTGLVSQQQTIINLCDKSIATSGNYRNFYIKDGKKYAHTIDPHSGYPVQSDILSASIITQNCMTADAYATAFMTLGLKKSCKLIEAINSSGHEKLDYYFIYSDEKGNLQVETSIKQ